ncbi:class I SAM-dependent methyltransferase [Nocardioides lijunqiniae]|uniref:class I SAM-dependent methyltransferase n=1 Tax=Nocardioides lijunqiniae TaxID=2760832 RepID=UPI001878C018|nr:class I SAM-dependent methyltransferase [Nocardioides lijunqiniae]
MTTAPVRGATGARVDDAGVLVRTPVEGPLVVSLDGRYVWAFTAARDGRSHRGGVLVPWPEVLRPYLAGWTRVRVADVSGEHVLLDEEVRLGQGDGQGDGRIAVVDAQGLPLAVDKVGHLGRAFSATDSGVRDEILAGTRRALTDLREACGVTAYLNYGALLGAVRDGAMIAHDSDTDVCYLSVHTSPADLILESYRVERILRDLGWSLLRMSGGDLKLLLPLSDGRVCHIDVFVAFRVDGTFYQLGNRSGRLPESAILPLSTVELHGVELPAPARPEEMLAFVYGPGWRVPDPAFKYADPVAGVRRLDGWLRGFRTDMGRWTAFHQGEEARRVPRRRSSFARWAHRQLPAGEPVTDLGAGTGRDALWLATRGRSVLAYDFSRAARSRLARRARRRELPVEARLLVLNELRSVLVTGAELARAESHLYARHLLGCLDEAARANLWRLSRMALRGHGGLLLLEFAADAGGDLPEPQPGGLVRRLAPDVVRREVEAAGGVIEHEELGPGEDLFDLPDPAVCRMRVAWPLRDAHARAHRTTAERTTP